MTSPASPNQPGEFARGATVFGRYVIDRCVRRDRIASVYAAHDRDQPTTWRNVWTVRADQIERSPEHARRFGLAMERVRALQHPSIAAVAQWHLEQQTPAVLSTLHAGRSLRDVIASEPFLGVEEVARAVVAVAEALTVMHQAKPTVMHHAVCPENVLCGDEGAVWLEGGGYLHALIAAGMTTAAHVATHAPPGYHVPQELLGREEPIADVFQLSVLAFEALTGQLPFAALTSADVSAALRGLLPSASALRPGISPEIDEVFDGVWRATLNRTEATPLAFARDLARVLGEDRSLRPTFPGASVGGSRGRPRLGAQVVSPADDALDVHEVSNVHGPQVIEFAPLPDPSSSAAPVDVTSVKPTLVGATGVRLSTQPPPPHDLRARGPLPRITRSRPPTRLRDEHPSHDERPPLDDRPTPSVGYERIKLLGADAEVVAQRRDAVDAAAIELEPDVVRPSPDTTSQIEQELLDVLRRTGAIKAPAHESAPRKDEMPPPPSHTTRPTAGVRAPVAPRATTSTMPRGEIPPPPRVPLDAIVADAEPSPPPSPLRAPSSPEVSIFEVVPEDSTTEITLSEILDAPPPPPKPSSRPPAVPAAAMAVQHDDLARPVSEHTAPQGSPLSARPNAVEPVSKAPALPSSRPPRLETPPPPVPDEPPTTRLPSSRPSKPSELQSSRTAPPVRPDPSPTTPPPAPPPWADNSWAAASRYLGMSTVVAALLVTGGMVYMRSSLDGLRADLAQYRAENAAQAPTPPDELPDVTATLADATVSEPPDAQALASPPDASLDVPLDRAEVDVTPSADVTPRADAARSTASTSTPSTTTPRPSGSQEGVPPESERVRLQGHVRAGVNDCIEGVESARMVVVNVRFNGITGGVERVRLHGVFAEPPLGPCIEEAVRRAQSAPFEAPFWETEFRFPVPQPRWRPPM